MSIYIGSLIQGIVQGITEFLPVSSTGHLILVSKFIDFSGEFEKMFDVVIQLGSILAVLVYFRHKLIPLKALQNPVEKKHVIQLWMKSAVGVIPALVIGALLGSLIQKYLYNPVTVAIALAAGGIVLIKVDNNQRKVSVKSIEDLTYAQAFLIGVAQCVAMIPGVSRSAATIVGGLLLGSARPVAVEYSFFLAIPTMVAASGYSLLKYGLEISPSEWGAVAIGFSVSFFVAWLVIAFFMSYIKKRDFKLFGYYRIFLGAVILIWFAFGGRI